MARGRNAAEVLRPQSIGLHGKTLQERAGAAGDLQPVGPRIARVVTLTSLQDNGGTQGGGADTAALAISSTVTIAATTSARPWPMFTTTAPPDPSM